MRIAFTGYSDKSINADGWYLDDVTVTRDAVPACTAAPAAVQLVTATSKSQQVTLEWLNPASGPFASTRVRTSTVTCWLLLVAVTNCTADGAAVQAGARRG